MIHTKDREMIIDQRTEEERLRDELRAKEISDRTLQFNPEKNQRISFCVSEDMKNLINTMTKLAHMNQSEFVRVLIIKEHHRLINLIRDGVPIEADNEEERMSIFDQIMRSVV